MKKLLFLIAIIAIFQSCKKEDTPTPDVLVFNYNGKAYSLNSSQVTGFKFSQYKEYYFNTVIGLINEYTLNTTAENIEFKISIQPKKTDATNFYLTANTYESGLNITLKDGAKYYKLIWGSKVVVTKSNAIGVTGATVSGNYDVKLERREVNTFGNEVPVDTINVIGSFTNLKTY